MSSPFGRLSLIVNRAAGGRAATRAVAALAPALVAQGLDFEVRPTGGPDHAVGLTRQVLDDGGRFVVAVGGDGTVHEVVNGMFDGDRPVAADAVLGVVAAGSGCDFVRTFGLPSSPTAAAARLGGSGVRALDVARIDYADLGGGTASRMFANIGEVGLGAATARRAGQVPAALGPARYFVAFWAVLPSYRPTTMTIEVDGEIAYRGRVANAVTANCRYFGGGMHISPASDPADGVLELLLFTGPKTDSFAMLPRIYRGTHLPHDRIVVLRGRRLAIDAERPCPVEADGEVLGTTPVTVEAVPRAVRLKV